MYSLSRRTCDNVPDERSPVTTNDLSVAFTDLQEFGIYRLTLTTVFDSFGTEVTAEDMEDFMTLTAGEYQRTTGPLLEGPCWTRELQSLDF